MKPIDAKPPSLCEAIHPSSVPSIARRVRAAGARRTRRHLTGHTLLLALATAFFWVCGALESAPAAASEPGGQNSATTRSLDEQVQEIKADVLAIASELGNLEERLLYPSNTQVAIFLALAEGQDVALDSAMLTIDGEVVTRHIYSFKELEALKKGGVQRIYTGNVRTGDHELEVSISGRRSSGKDFAQSERFVFSKAVGPELVGITLSTGLSGDAAIAIEGW